MLRKKFFNKDKIEEEQEVSLPDIIVDEIKNENFQFCDIAAMSDPCVQKVLRNTDEQDLAKALRKTSNKIQEIVFRNLSSRASVMLKENMEYMGPQLLKDVEESQRKIASIIQKLSDNGEILVIDIAKVKPDPTEEKNMTSTAMEVLSFVKENDVRFIRLAFCDIFGMQKNIAIMAEELETAFEDGISFDAHVIKGFKDVTDSDLLLFPDPVTLNVLPWRPGPGRVARFYCDIKNPDGTFFSHDGRAILKKVTERADKMGYTCKVGAECEFYLFKTDDNGDPTLTPFDKGGYLDLLPLDKGENIRREICQTLAEMRMQPETSHHEQGPGQNEVDFKFSNAVEAADNLQAFKTVVKAVAERNGLFASFMPKPSHDAPGNGLHINLSLNQNGRNVFKNTETGELSAASENFIAGILSKIREITLFLNPTANSYERFGKFDAPKFISWSPHNRSQLVRIPAAAGERVRMELRSPDPSANPYMAFALIISAGLDGIENKTVLPPSVNVDLFTADESVTKNLDRIPDSLRDAIDCAGKSAFVNAILTEELLNKFLDAKLTEAEEFEKAKDKNEFYKNKYFTVL